MGPRVCVLLLTLVTQRASREGQNLGGHCDWAFTPSTNRHSVNGFYSVLSLHWQEFFPHSFHFWIVCLHLKFNQVLLSVFNYNLMVTLLAFQLPFSFHITKVHPSYCVIIISCYNGFIMQVPAGLN